MISRRNFIRSGAALSGITLAGCTGDSGSSDGSSDGSSGGDTGSDGSSDDGETAYQAAVSLPTLGYEWFPRVQQRFNDLVDQRDDLEGTVYNAEGDISQQITDIETAVTNDVDFLIVDPLQGEGTGPGIEDAQEADIPVINLDREIQDADYAAYVGADNVAMGQRSTELCLELMQEREEKSEYNIIQLQGVPGSSVSGDRTEGFEAAIDDHDELNVLEDQTANWSKSEAISLTEDFVVSHGDDIDGVFCQNDQMALGVAEVLQDNDMGDVPITGIDGLKEWLQTFEDNSNHGTIGQRPEDMTDRCVEFGINVLEGEDVPEQEYVESPELTQENYEDYMQEYLSDV